MPWFGSKNSETALSKFEFLVFKINLRKFLFFDSFLLHFTDFWRIFLESFFKISNRNFSFLYRLIFFILFWLNNESLGPKYNYFREYKWKSSPKKKKKKSSKVLRLFWEKNNICKPACRSFYWICLPKYTKAFLSSSTTCWNTLDLQCKFYSVDEKVSNLKCCFFR